VRRAYVLYFKNIFSDFCLTNYLNFYVTDLHEICSIGRTLAIDERSEVIFSIPWGVAMATNILGKIDLQYALCSSHHIR